MIEEETQEEMREFEIREEQKYRDRTEFLSSEVEDWVPDEKIYEKLIFFIFPRDEAWLYREWWNRRIWLK